MKKQTSSVGRDSDKFMLRFPDGMRDRIREAAEGNKRSMNAEIVARLEQTFDPSQGSAGFLDSSIHSILNRSTGDIEATKELEESLRNAASISETLKSIDFRAMESFTKTLENIDLPALQSLSQIAEDLRRQLGQQREKDIDDLRKLASKSFSDIAEEELEQAKARIAAEKETPKKRP